MLNIWGIRVALFFLLGCIKLGETLVHIFFYLECSVFLFGVLCFFIKIFLSYEVISYEYELSLRSSHKST